MTVLSLAALPAEARSWLGFGGWFRGHHRALPIPNPTDISTATPTVPPSATPTTPPSSTTPSTPPASATATAPVTTSAPSSGDCGRQAGASAVTKVTEVSLGSQVVSFAPQGDTEALPMAIAATPSGGSWLAWLGTDSQVHLGRLDCDDKLVGTPTSFDGIDLQDVRPTRTAASCC